MIKVLSGDTVADGQKVNGFMAGATVYNGKWLVSTTGTLDSDYARLAKSVIDFDVNPRLVDSKTWQAAVMEHHPRK